MPAWVKPADLDSAQWFMPTVPPRQGAELRAAALAHRQALAPATFIDRRNALRELRGKTTARNEHPEEARASFDMLVDDLSDVPFDILLAACHAYANQPGRRFFPRGAGELREFTVPLMFKRTNYAWRLDEMAKASDVAFDEADRCTPEQLAAIKAEFGIETEAKPAPRPDYGHRPRTPTRADYIAMGIDPASLDQEQSA